MSSPDLRFWRVLLLMVLVSCAGQASEIIELKPSRVLPIESAVPVEPSGLCLRDGRLFSVSDDTDDAIFEVVIEGDVARFKPALRFSPPERGAGKLDLEGIAVGPDGSFYLASERHARVLQVFPDGASEWLTPSALDTGRARGLFRDPGGRVEGLTRLSGGELLLAAERQPRGLLTWREEEGFSAQGMKETRFSKRLSMLRLPDFTGLDAHGGKTWALFRNAELITTVERGPNGWREGSVGWSYRSIVQDPKYAYRSRMFGTAEGLAVSDRFFYVVLDNNGDSRTEDRSDDRPLLLILERP